MTCSHVRITRSHQPRRTVVRCRDCNHWWCEFPIYISDTEYDATLAIMAQRLDNK